MWAALALAAGDEPGVPASGSLRRALARPEGGRPGVSTESLLLRLLVERRFGDPGQAGGLLAKLLVEQRPDGGRGWLRDGRAGDAFATGQALYALGVSGRWGEDPAGRRD